MKSPSDEGIPNNIIRYVNCRYFQLILSFLFFSEIKALQEIEDHENVCKRKTKSIRFLY
jgi:hypothetical protein